MPVVPSAVRQVDPGGRVRGGAFRSTPIAVEAPLRGILPGFRQRKAPSPVFQSAAGATPEAFGAGVARAKLQTPTSTGIGEGLGALGTGLLNLTNSLEQIQRQEQEIELKTLDVQFSNNIRNLMYGNPEDNQEGFLSSKTQDAVAKHIPLRAAIAKVREDLIKGVSSKNVRDRFILAANGRIGHAYTQAARHVIAERQQAAIVISQARIDNARNDASNNPETLKDGLATVSQEIMKSMSLQGISNEEAVASEILKAHSKTVAVSIAGSLSREQDQEALKTLKEFGPFMAANDLARANISVANALMVTSAQSVFDQIVSLGLTGDERAKYVRDNTSGKLRDSVVARLRQYDTTKRSDIGFAQRQEEKVDAKFVSATVEAAIVATEDPDERRSLIKEWADLEPEQFTPRIRQQIRNKLITHDGQQQQIKARQLKEAQSFFHEGIVNGRDLNDLISSNPGYGTVVKRSPAVYNNLKAADSRRASGEIFAELSDGETLHSLRGLNVDELADVNLSIVRHKLTQREFEVVSRMHAAAKHSLEDKNPSHSAIYASGRRILKNILPKNRDFGSAKASNVDRLFNRQAENAVSTSIHQYIQANGKPPPENVLNDIVHEAVLEIDLESPGLFGGIFRDNEIDLIERREITPDQKARAYVSFEKISLRRVTQMKDDVRRRSTKYPGGNVPEKILERAYGAYVLQDLARYKQLLGIP